MKSVMLGMSGGVDSSAAAVMLLEQGFEVSGVTLILKDGEQTLRDVESARNVADALGIEHHTVDLREKFSNEVIANFASEYKRGRTPNPCCVCNMKIKFGAMLDFALENGADGIATGHYAKLKKDEESGKTYQFITNNFRVAASSIAEIYKQRWQIELFFQMDQAEFEDKKLSRHKRKRCDVANLGGNDPLSADCLSQISAWVQVGNDGADQPYS